MRFLHYSQRTEDSYWQWIVRFLRFHRRKSEAAPSKIEPQMSKEEPGGGWRHPRDLSAPEVAEFLTHLAEGQQLAAATQNQALHPVR